MSDLGSGSARRQPAARHAPDPAPAADPAPPAAAEPGEESGVAVVVGAAVIRTLAPGRLAVLAAQRSYPSRLAGQWEFPGGKVEAGETDEAALRRECREELGAEVEVGPRIGPDLPVGAGIGPDLPVGPAVVLRVYLARLRPGAGVGPPAEHAALRWLTAAELESVPWLAPDRPLLGPLAAFLRAGSAEWPAAERPATGWPGTPDKAPTSGQRDGKALLETPSGARGGKTQMPGPPVQT